jgi:hypothetical protein
LLASDGESALEIRFSFCCVWLGRLEGDFACNAVDLGLAPFFFRLFYFVYRVVNATLSIVKLAKFRIRLCQILQVLRFIKSCSS